MIVQSSLGHQRDLGITLPEARMNLSAGEVNEGPNQGYNLWYVNQLPGRGSLQQ